MRAYAWPNDPAGDAVPPPLLHDLIAELQQHTDAIGDIIRMIGSLDDPRSADLAVALTDQVAPAVDPLTVARAWLPNAGADHPIPPRPVPPPPDFALVQELAAAVPALLTQDAQTGAFTLRGMGRSAQPFAADQWPTCRMTVLTALRAAAVPVPAAVVAELRQVLQATPGYLPAYLAPLLQNIQQGRMR